MKAEFERTPKCFKEQIYAAVVAIPITLCSKMPHFMKQSLSNYRAIYTILRCNLKENGWKGEGRGLKRRLAVCGLKAWLRLLCVVVCEQVVMLSWVENLWYVSVWCMKNAATGFAMSWVCCNFVGNRKRTWLKIKIMAKKALLMILDGWGIGKRGKGDVIYNSPTP